MRPAEGLARSCREVQASQAFTTAPSCQLSHAHCHSITSAMPLVAPTTTRNTTTRAIIPSFGRWVGSRDENYTALGLGEMGRGGIDVALQLSLYLEPALRVRFRGTPSEARITARARSLPLVRGVHLHHANESTGLRDRNIHTNCGISLEYVCGGCSNSHRLSLAGFWWRDTALRFPLRRPEVRRTVL